MSRGPPFVLEMGGGLPRGRRGHPGPGGRLDGRGVAFDLTAYVPSGILAPTDAVIRLSATRVRGSDLWPYRGIEAVDGPSRRRREPAAP
ncbi:hypothetical protein ACWEFL_07335 [Streptomyces sp. NPDC004838]